MTIPQGFGGGLVSVEPKAFNVTSCSQPLPDLLLLCLKAVSRPTLRALTQRMATNSLWGTIVFSLGLIKVDPC